MLSYARGRETALREQTIDAALKEAVSQWGNCEALVVPQQEKRFTFSQLDAEVERVAMGMAGLGLRATDRVGIWATGCAEWILVQLACARIGAILININPAYRLHDLRYILRKSRMKALFLHAKDARADYCGTLAEACEDQTLELAHTVFFGEHTWQEMPSAGVKTADTSIQPSDVVNIQYTSGTTGNSTP